MDDGPAHPVAAAAAPATAGPAGHRCHGAAAAAATGAIAVKAEPQAAAQPHLPEDEVALVRAFGTHGLVKEALHRRSQELKGTRGGARGTRIPNTLRAIERRWFVGRQTVQKATEKTNELRTALAAGAAGVAASDALIGTATLLALAAEGSGLVKLISTQGGPAAPFCELHLYVKSPQRGGSTVKGFTRKTLDHKAYYIHQDVVSACLQHAEQHCQLQALRQEGREMRLETALPTQLLLTSPRVVPQLTSATYLDERIEALSPAAPDWTVGWVSEVDLSSSESYDISDGSGDSDIDFASIGSVSDQDELGPSSLWEERYQDDRWSTDDLTATSIGTGSEQDINSLTSMSDDDVHGFPDNGTGAVSASCEAKRDWGQHGKRPHEQLFVEDDETLFVEDDEKLFVSTAQQGADTYEKRASPHTRRKTGTAAAGTFLATAAWALILLVVHHSRPGSTTSDDSLISPVRPAMVWTLEGIDTSIGLFQGGKRNKCVSPASVTQMCEASGSFAHLIAVPGSGQTSGRTCVMQNAAARMWPRWRQQNAADALPDVVTACGQLGGATPLLPALSRRLAVKGAADGLNCRVKWGSALTAGNLIKWRSSGSQPDGLSAAAVNAGLRHTTGLRNSGGIMWTTDRHVRLYLFASAYPCRSLENGVSIGACGIDITEEDTIEIYGDTVGGLWSYDLLSGSEEGWTRQSNSEIRAATVARTSPEPTGIGDLLVQNRRTLPPARNNAVQWSFPSGSVFIMGGSGCTTEPHAKRFGFECEIQDLSDLWHWDVATGLWSCLYMPERTTGASSIVTLHYQWSAENGGLPAPASDLFEEVEGLWPIARRGRSAWSTCDNADSSDCELWLFGGEIVGSGAVHMTVLNTDGSDYRAYDGTDDKVVVQIREVAPVDSLWRYSVQGGAEGQRGSWMLVAGWDDGTMCRMSSPSKVHSPPPCRGLDADGRWADYANTILTSAAVPVDPCAHVWPRDRETGEFVRFADSHCPPSRYAAAAWADSRPGAGGWIFGGLNSMNAGVILFPNPNTINGLGLGDEIHDDELTETLIETILVDNRGPDGWAASMMFDDLWHFNGDAVKPRWLRVPRPAGVSEWPIAGAGRGWTDNSQLWLSMGVPSEQWPSTGDTGRLLPAQLWAFSVEAETWEQIGSDVNAGSERPAARRGELLDSGWLFGGMGGAECAEKAQPSNPPAPGVRELEGLWRWGRVPSGE